MNPKPTTEEARIDLNDIRNELEAMRRILADATWLSMRNDVDAPFYAGVVRKVTGHIDSGSGVERSILKNYPELL